MLARKLKSLKQIHGSKGGNKSHDKDNFRVRKVDKSSKKKQNIIPSLKDINDIENNLIDPNAMSIVKSLKEIGSNKDLLKIQKQLVQDQKLGLTFQLKKLYTITKQGQKRMQQLVKIRSMKQLLTDKQPIGQK